MEIYEQFTPVYSVIISVILLFISLVMIRLKKQDWKILGSWKTLILALVFVLSGLMHSEVSVDKDWKMEAYGFPHPVLLSKSSIDQNAFLQIGIMRFHYINFILNLILFYLLINVFIIGFKQKKT